MSTTSPRRFLEQLWGIRPGHQSPKPTSVESTTESQPLSDGVAAWLYRMWGIRPPRREQRAA